MDRRTTNHAGSAELPPPHPGAERWQSLEGIDRQCGDRCAGGREYAWDEVLFVHRVEQAAFLLEFLAEHLEGSDTDALTRGRRMLDLAREQLDHETAEAEERVDSGWEEGSNAAAFDKFHEASGDFLTQVESFSRMLAAADDCLLRAARERRIHLGAFQLLVRSVVGLAKRAIADADAARDLLSASLR